MNVLFNADIISSLWQTSAIKLFKICEFNNRFNLLSKKMSLNNDYS